MAGRRQPQKRSRTAAQKPSEETAEALLRDPALWDALPLIGVGTSAQIRRRGPWVVKIAHPGAHRTRLQQEVATLRALADAPEHTLAPSVIASLPDGRAFIRSFVDGTCLLDLLEAQEPSRMGETVWLPALLDCHRAKTAWQNKTGEVLDFVPPNLFWNAKEQRFQLVDLGLRLDAEFFAGPLDDQTIVEALLSYRAWRRDRPGLLQVEPPVMPPSGRFHVDTPVGRARGARLLWVNESAVRRHRLPLVRADLLELTNRATWAPSDGRPLPSTRYQDAPHKGEGWARGDGRAVRAGRLRGLDLVVKGCGPTALRWAGNPYHEDGLVSLNRTLWEAAICDELARLGIVTPEVLAVSPQTGQVTIDQTDVSWPAASGLRASRCHWRLGHLVHFSDDRGALTDLLQHLCWEGVLPEGFDPARLAHLRWMVLRFARHLGHDTGRCDGLNIQCFNPTLGNVRVDGHFLDFSTVRFMRHYTPDFVYMNGQRRVREVRSAHRRHVGVLVDALRRATFLSAAQATALETAATRTYEGHYETGMLAALGMYLGLDLADVDPVPPATTRSLVSHWRRLRQLRARERITFRFWEQEHRAPLFDLEGLFPAFVERVLDPDGEEAWPALRSSFGGRLGTREAEGARKFEASFRRALNTLPAPDRPRRWSQIVRPFMECEALADLCYRRSRPDRLGAFGRALASSRSLPEGDYSWFEARTEALRAGHVVVPTVKPRGVHVVIGLYPELAEGILQSAQDLVGDALVGLAVHGPRVGPPANAFCEEPSLVERGADLRHTTPLSLALFAHPTEDPTEEVVQALSRLLGAMSATLPIALEIITVERAVTGGRAAATAWAERQGLPPADLGLLHDVGGDSTDPLRSFHIAVGRSSAGTAVPVDRILSSVASAVPLVSPLQLTLALMDDPNVHPSPLPARRVGHRFELLGPWAGIADVAARAAGREVLLLDLEE